MKPTLNPANDRLKHSMRTLLRTLLICLLVPGAVALAQDPPPPAAVAPPENPLSLSNKFLYGAMKKILLRSAETMSEEDFAFKPTEAVRSFGQIVGHLADSNYLFCSAVLGESNPALNIEKTKTSKAELIAALTGAFAYCDPAYAGLTDASAAQIVKFGAPTPKLSVLNLNNMHNALHYGNLITYMRLKNIVPPTSEPEFLQRLRP